VIKITKNIMIDADEYNYVIKQRIKKKDKEEYYWKAVAYHSKLENALESVFDFLGKKEIKSKELTINQAIKVMKDLRREIIENTRTGR